ncbi:MAG: hypothetical protein ACXWEJ_10810 [Actinomycetota bacterium]
MTTIESWDEVPAFESEAEESAFWVTHIARRRRGVQPRHQSLLQLRDAQPLRRGDRLVIEGDRQPAICISRITL